MDQICHFLGFSFWPFAICQHVTLGFGDAPFHCLTVCAEADEQPGRETGNLLVVLHEEEFLLLWVLWTLCSPHDFWWVFKCRSCRLFHCLWVLWVVAFRTWSFGLGYQLESKKFTSCMTFSNRWLHLVAGYLARIGLLRAAEKYLPRGMLAREAWHGLARCGVQIAVCIWPWHRRNILASRDGVLISLWRWTSP